MGEDDPRDSASREEIAAATAYERLHVSALFQQWTPWVRRIRWFRSD